MACITILVVEDEPLLRMLATDILQDAGFKVTEAGTGEEGLSILATNPDVSVLFTDVHMPGVPDGFALARIASESYPHVATVIVSGNAMPRDGELPKGAVFIPKPYRSDQLLGTIAKLLSEPKQCGDDVRPTRELPSSLDR
ncbi:response regulator [Microvirga brassicacearum]|uniref:Response regulator n=1 Tax=Microvirga brassicacearum TaxID=2580413 RepID=A0A5N3P712_9HYPH|nr:response regulator [Microvirga brassicacearum]KAB0265520.1 response regulator [Microvirga brassicacearum]